MPRKKAKSAEYKILGCQDEEARRISVQYLAGLFDGEGYVCISKQIKRRSGKVRVSYSSFIGIIMCHRQILEIVHQQFGGVLREGVRSNPKHNNIWIWQLYGGKAGELLIKLQPYLIVKQERVKLFLEYLQRKSKQKGSSKGRPRNESWYSQEFHEYSEEVFQRLKSMNKKGKHEI